MTAGETSDQAHLRFEALTMALYLSIVLLALLASTGPYLFDIGDQLPVLIPSTAFGLVLAHVFAFSLSHAAVSNTPHGMRTRLRHRLHSVGAMFAGALAVVLLAEIPVLLVDDIKRATLWSELLLSAVIGATAWYADRAAGSSRAHAAVYTGVIVVISMVLVTIKSALGGH